MPTITFHVDGLPAPQPRTKARAMIRKLGKRIVPIGQVYDPGDADDWKAMVALEARNYTPRKPLEDLVELEIRVFLPRPEKYRRAKDPDGPMRCGSRGDWDNYGKAIGDVLTQLGFWRDDNQVWRGVVEKYYAPKLGKPGAEVTLRWEEMPIAPAPDPSLFADEASS
jgi:Holliday junction resolvase RusA-like endonuclease